MFTTLILYINDATLPGNRLVCAIDLLDDQDLQNTMLDGFAKQPWVISLLLV